MKKYFPSVILVIATCFLAIKSSAQQFIEKAEIIFEVKTNVKKTMGNSSWAEMMKENLPQFKTGYFAYTFANNKSIYKFKEWSADTKLPEWMRKNDEENSWFYDYEKSTYAIQKEIVGTKFNVEDSIQKIDWRLTNESRVIAGFNCRKAVGKILDSVYVFAFYTDEIIIPGGPCTINGLPGMILGLTIPRMYTSYIATKVSVNGIDESAIKPTFTKKGYTNKVFISTLKDRTKDWWSDADNDEDSKQWKNQFLWAAML
jgi:GLPGLI family protein